MEWNSKEKKNSVILESFRRQYHRHYWAGQVFIKFYWELVLQYKSAHISWKKTDLACSLDETDKYGLTKDRCSY